EPSDWTDPTQAAGIAALKPGPAWPPKAMRCVRCTRTRRRSHQKFFQESIRFFHSIVALAIPSLHSGASGRPPGGATCTDRRPDSRICPLRKRFGTTLAARDQPVGGSPALLVTLPPFLDSHSRGSRPPPGLGFTTARGRPLRHPRARNPLARLF